MSNPVNDDDADVTGELPEAARELEAALSRLKPAGSIGVGAGEAGANDDEISFRDRLMFRAGEAAGAANERATATWQLRMWRGAAAVLAAVSIAMFARILGPGSTPVRVEYVRIETPSTRLTDAAAGTSKPFNAASVENRPDAVRYGNESAVGFAANWMGVRGDYLTTRAAVLRWGVAALPSERLPDSAGQPGKRTKDSTFLDLSGQDEATAPSPRTPAGPLKQLEQWFSHPTNGDRL